MRLIYSCALSALFVLSAAGDDAAAVKDFRARVDEYAKIRKAAADQAPPLPKAATPQEIVQHEKALVSAIRAARPAAKQGDIFTADVQPVFARILRDVFVGRGKKENREVAKQGNPRADAQPDEAQPVLQVNAEYPKSAPLSSVPPSLLLQLPPLPKDVEYRFVGNALILWDNISNLVIDYMRGAAPGL